jgi:SNF2 family DNA or RNA helicase
MYAYQERALAHVQKYARCALFLEPGLGKTRVAIEALKDFPKPAIVLAPKRVIEHTWPDELKKWSPNTKFVSLSVNNGKRALAYNTDADVYLLNYELLDRMFGAEGEFVWKFPTVIIDESTKIKNRATKTFRALRRHAGKWQRLIELTGTPSPKSLEDLWTQVYLLDRGERLGRTLTAFRERWFRQGYCAWDRVPLPHAQREIQEKIADICLSMRADDYLNLPEMIVQDIKIELSPPAQAAYKELKRKLILEVADTEITALNAAALTTKLLQLTSGKIYDVSGKSQLIHTAKMDALQDLIEEVGDENLLIVYAFKSELESLRKFGVVELRDSHNIVERWNAGKISLLAIHPASAGHGLNLQQGGHHVCWTTPTFNLEWYSQTNARLYRNGQTKPVVIHRLVAAGTVDEHVLQSLESKTIVQDLLMRALKG